MNYIAFIAAAVIFLLIVKLIFKKGIKTIIKLAINIILGGAILFLVNYIPYIAVEINLVNSLLVGIFGVPAVIVLVIYYLIINK